MPTIRSRQLGTLLGVSFTIIIKWVNEPDPIPHTRTETGRLLFDQDQALAWYLARHNKLGVREAKVQLVGVNHGHVEGTRPSRRWGK